MNMKNKYEILKTVKDFFLKIYIISGSWIISAESVLTIMNIRVQNLCFFKSYNM